MARRLICPIYSIDATTWFELPQVTAADLVLIEKIQGKLSGDPAAEHEIPKDGKSRGQRNSKTHLVAGGVEETKIKEDVRIAGIVRLINNDVEIVPRKLYYRDAAMKIQRNPDFKGIFIQLYCRRLTIHDRIGAR